MLSVLPFKLVGQLRDGIRLLGIFLMMVSICLNPWFSNIAFVIPSVSMSSNQVCMALLISFISHLCFLPVSNVDDVSL